MKISRTLIKTMFISSLILFPVSANANVVPCYKHHVDLEYKLDTDSIFQRDKFHVNTLVYKYENGELVSKAVYQFQFINGEWHILIYDGHLPEVLFVNKKNKLETVKAETKWIPVSIAEEYDNIVRLALIYSKGTYLKE